MKKRIACLLAGVLLVCHLGGCGLQTADYAFDLGKRPVAVHESLEIGKGTSVTAVFTVPADGVIRFRAYDSTEYGTDGREWPEEEPTFVGYLKDEWGNTLYKRVNLSQPGEETYVVKAGTLVVTIFPEGATEGLTGLTLSWAYAAESATPTPLTLEEPAAAVVSKKGEAAFALTVEKAALLDVYPAPACGDDYDCSFYVLDEDGNKVVEDLLVHSTEWIYRRVYLPVGDYRVVVTGVEKLATCRVNEFEDYTANQFSADTGDTLPALFGFTALTTGKRTATFTAGEDTKYLVVTTNGSDTYYDSEQAVTVTITDSTGRNVCIEDCEGEYWIDVPYCRGECTVTVEAHNSCVVELTVSSSSYVVNTFSYEGETADYTADTPGVRTSGFKNTKKVTVTSPDDVVELAKKEVTVSNDSVSVAYDEATGMWSVYFWTVDVAGGDVTVYIDENGITKMTVAGE